MNKVERENAVEREMLRVTKSFVREGSGDRVRKDITENEYVKDGTQEKEKERQSERCEVEYVLGFAENKVFLERERQSLREE